MGYVTAFLLFSLIIIGEAAPKKSTKDKQTHTKTPAAGWCCGNHRPRVAAQSGYVDSKGNPYCKICYRESCPRLYAAKQKKRQAECRYCGEMRELKQGFCRPSHKARGCNGCGEFNTESDAVVCVSCCCRRLAQGANAEQLASWCLRCTTEEQRQSQCCPFCYETNKGRPCHHCGLQTQMNSMRHKCVGTECTQIIDLCMACKSLEFSSPRMLCKTCWKKEQVWIFCNGGRAQQKDTKQTNA